jgi:large subunit ribosomal protein L18
MNHLYVQVIDDVAGIRLLQPLLWNRPCSLSWKARKKAEAAVIGRVVAERALDAGIRQVVFDRGGYPVPWPH